MLHRSMIRTFGLTDSKKRGAVLYVAASVSALFKDLWIFFDKNMRFCFGRMSKHKPF